MGLTWTIWKASRTERVPRIGTRRFEHINAGAAGRSHSWRMTSTQLGAKLLD
jgi:hypothetical protein